MTIPLSRNAISELAGEVLDVLSEVNAIEDRLTGVLRRLLALDPDTHEAPAPLVLSEKAFLGGSVSGTKVAQTPGSTLTVSRNADLVENEDGTVEVVVPGTGIRRGKGSHDPSEGDDACVVSFTKPDERAWPQSTKRGDGRHFKGRTRQEINATSRDVQNRILDLWAETTFSKSDIGRTVGVNESTVRKTIEKAKRRGDSRGIEPEQRPHETPTTTLAQQDDPTLRIHAPDPEVVGKGEDERPRLVQEDGQSGAGSAEEPQADNEVGSGDAAPVAAAGEGSCNTPSPAASDGYDEMMEAIAEVMAQPAAEPEITLPPTDDVVETIAEAIAAIPSAKPAIDRKVFKGEPHHALQFDDKGNRVAGPDGVLDLPGSILRMFKHMADGRIYDLRTISDKGGYQDLTKCYEALRTYGGKLQTIGVEVVFVSKQLFRIRRVGE